MKKKKEHTSAKAKRLDELSDFKKDFLIGVWENSHKSSESLTEFAKELGVVPLTLVRKVKYWQFRKTTQ